MSLQCLGLEFTTRRNRFREKNQCLQNVYKSHVTAFTAEKGATIIHHSRPRCRGTFLEVKESTSTVEQSKSTGALREPEAWAASQHLADVNDVKQGVLTVQIEDS